MTDLINRDELMASIVNRQAKIPDILPYRDFKAFIDGYTACQHDILDIVRDAPAVARMQIRPHLSNTEDKDKPLRMMRHSCGAVIVYRGRDVCPNCGKAVDWGV